MLFGILFPFFILAAIRSDAQPLSRAVVTAVLSKNTSPKAAWKGASHDDRWEAYQNQAWIATVTSRPKSPKPAG
jgi:hypothetical protein